MRFVAVGAIEPQFYAELLNDLEIDPASLPAQMEVSAWPKIEERFDRVFRERSRDEWTAVFEGTDACVTPVLTFAEVPHHPHIVARGTITAPDGFPAAAPAPRFSVTPAAAPAVSDDIESLGEVLAAWTRAPHRAGKRVEAFSRLGADPSHG